MNKVYEKMTLSLISTLMEDTPSKRDIEAAQHIPGYTVRPEDDTKLTKGDKGLKRIFIARRKEKVSGKSGSKGTGTKRLIRQLKSHVWDPSQRAELKAKLEKKRKGSKARRDAKGKSDLMQDLPSQGETGPSTQSMLDNLTTIKPKKK